MATPQLMRDTLTAILAMKMKHFFVRDISDRTHRSGRTLGNLCREIEALGLISEEKHTCRGSLYAFDRVKIEEYLKNNILEENACK